jgi:hypothetical protein
MMLKRQETVEMVKRGILTLSEIAPERFAFQVFVQSEWVIVLDEVWELLRRDPPLVWAVTIRELPEEREQREFSNPSTTSSSYWVKAHPFTIMRLPHQKSHIMT